MHKLPVHKMVAIFPGVSSALNFAGRSTARCGMCKSPMHNTKTIFMSNGFMKSWDQTIFKLLFLFGLIQPDRIESFNRLDFSRLLVHSLFHRRINEAPLDERLKHSLLVMFVLKARGSE